MDGKDEVAQAIKQEIAHSIAKKIAIGIAILIGFIVFMFVGGILVQWLWNWLLPDIFGLRRVTFWEAFGLLALSRILFGGFGRSGGSRRYSSGGRRDGAPWWKKPKTAAPFEAAPHVPPAPPT
jgi:uncharacterized membrane protein YgcG